MSYGKDECAHVRATDKAEYDEAARVIAWLRERAVVARDAGQDWRTLTMLSACAELERVFLLPVEEYDE